jgi:hypothetical protein
MSKEKKEAWLFGLVGGGDKTRLQEEAHQIGGLTNIIRKKLFYEGDFLEKKKIWSRGFEKGFFFWSSGGG